MSVLGFMHSENSPSTPSKGTLLSSDSLIWHNYFKKVNFAFYGTYVYFIYDRVAFIIHMDTIFISLFHRILNYYRRVYSFYVLYFAVMLILARLIKCQILDQDCDLHIFYCIIFGHTFTWQWFCNIIYRETRKINPCFFPKMGFWKIFFIIDHSSFLIYYWILKVLYDISSIQVIEFRRIFQT